MVAPAFGLRALERRFPFALRVGVRQIESADISDALQTLRAVRYAKPLVVQLFGRILPGPVAFGVINPAILGWR